MTAIRHSFESKEPVERFTETSLFYGELRGTKYHRVMPMPQTRVSDCRQIARAWNAAVVDALPAFKKGIATAWKDIFKGWEKEAKRLHASKQATNEVYEHNEPFWLALRRLATQLNAKDMIMTRGEVLVWAVKESVRERVEDVQDAGAAVHKAGKAAASAATGAVEAIPTIAKALAVGAVGLGVYAVAKRS